LHAIQADAEVLKAAARSEHASKTVLDLSTKQYQSGYISYQNLLAAQQSYQLSVVTLVQAQSGRLGDTAGLYQALGGGWWNHSDDKSTEGCHLANDRYRDVILEPRMTVRVTWRRRAKRVRYVRCKYRADMAVSKGNQANVGQRTNRSAVGALRIKVVG